MAYKALIFGTDDAYEKLKPFYEAEVKRGNLEIVARGTMEGDNVNIVYADGRRGGVEDIPNFDLAIISTLMNFNKNDFYPQMKLLEAYGFPSNCIIDGRVFRVPDLSFDRLLNERVAYGFIEKNDFHLSSFTIYPQVYDIVKKNGSSLSLGTKSYIHYASITGVGVVSIGKFSSLSTQIVFNLGRNSTHNYRNVSTVAVSNWDWPVSEKFFAAPGRCKVLIGSDVWSGQNANFKCTNPNKPLVIGDGAVIASDSVVVKNVPPYAIVGGNPAKVIKYRFPPHVIKALLRIKWWDWSLDKIHDNFKYFNDVEKFISLHDPLKDATAPEDEKFLGYDIENTFDLDTDKIRNNFR
ncbi:MAG: CatB-related O-acetyltransferase [Selenomonadaceae bacterium]|nr:CatB-related O-acetyltransferase [Selenomonadaceae bacterium]MBQ6759520.1 CatB-related O-acetyltransferase [Selenomonadaceae bacterium]MBR0101908.1 CatB-related O-acetyltransferase [Selenomonadaceae bacterium]